MNHSKKQAIQRDWISKTLAGLLLGLALGFGISAIYAALDSDVALPVRGQIAMWMVAPVWLAVLGGVYFFTSGTRAWLWLGAANLLVYGAAFVLRGA